jgi:signal transduction histidine kinase
MEKRALSLQAQRLAALEAEARDLARQKAELERLDKIKSTFTLTVAHELRAPVAAIQSYLRLILDGYIAPEDQVKYLARAERRARAQLELVNDLLDLARLQDPDIRIEVAHVRLEQVLQEVLDAMAANAEENDITIELTVEPDLPPIEMNARHAKQLWTNLISNAIKYSHKGGTARVSLTCQDQDLVGVVADQGIGIAADEQALVFEEFYRSKASKKHTQMGTGLGLPIVKRILDSYGGTIGLESEEGKGSTFTFTLPLPQSWACTSADTDDTSGS